MKPPEHFNGMVGEGELNPGFEDENRRKISIVSNDRERKVSSISMPKSILVNGDNLSHLSHVEGSGSQESVGGKDKEGSSRLLESIPPGYNSLATEPPAASSSGLKSNQKEKEENKKRLSQDSEESISREGKEGVVRSSLFIKGYNSLAARPSQSKRTRLTTDHGRVSLPSELPASFTYPGEEDDLGNSWWYILCTKCRQKETGPGWEPSFWQSVCPYPFCPTYRHVARVFALLLLFLLAWGVIFSIMGQDSAPGGQFFDIALLCICGHIGGWMFKMIALPPLVGMLLVGIIFRNVGFIEIHGPYNEMVSVLRKIALVNILIRAGLDLDSGAMKRLWPTVLKIGLLPWILECGVLVVLSHFFLGLPWMWGLLLGSIVAAVSPAVVVPCLFRLRNKGYGVAKGIPSLIIAISGIDDAASVAAFGIITSIMFSSNSLYFEVLLGLLSIVIGILFGILWGVLASYVPEKDDPFVVPLRILILLGGGLIAVLGSDLVGLGGAGPLGCIAAAFLSVYAWTKQGWDVEDNPVATAFEIFWMIFEPILFALTGTQIKISEMDPSITGIGIAILVGAFLLRIMLTIVVAFGASLNLKEKIFCGLSLMAKASVQAALGPIAVDIVRDREGPEPGYAHTVALICVMSILFAAPVGAILIIITGSKLLTKTEVPMIPDGWRRSARPSLRDISITEDFRDNDSFRTHRPSVITEEPKFP